MWETHDSLRRASGGFFCVFFVRSLTPFSWRHCFIAFFLVLILISDTPAAEIANRNSTRAMSPMTILSVTDFTHPSKAVTTIRNSAQRSGVALRFDTGGVHCGGQASIKGTTLVLEPSAPLEVALFTACGDWGASGGGLGGGVSVVSYDSESEESWVHELEREMTESDDLVHCGGQASIKTSLVLEPSAPLKVAPFQACFDWGATG